MVDADQRPEQHAARGRHPGADREDCGVHPRHRNAHGLRHDPVLRGGADPDAVGAVFEEQPERADDRAGEHRDQHAVPGILQIEERELAGEGLRDLARDRAELPQRIVLHHQRNAEGRENRGQGIAAEQRTQRGDLQRRPDQRHDQRGEHEGEPEAAGRGHHQDAHIGAEHEQLAVGEVHHVHDAEDQGEAGGDQGEDHSGDDAVDRLNDDHVPGNVLEQVEHRPPHTPRYWWITASFTLSSDAAQWWRMAPFSMM